MAMPCFRISWRLRVQRSSATTFRKRVKPISERKKTTSFASTMPRTIGLKWVMKLKFEIAPATPTGRKPSRSP
jgi:hypothetical protein